MKLCKTALGAGDNCPNTTWRSTRWNSGNEWRRAQTRRHRLRLRGWPVKRILWMSLNRSLG